MRVLSTFRRASNVRRALQKATEELNEGLARTPGCITHMDADVGTGVAGATVRIIVTVDESDIKPKCILWANEPGSSSRSALRRAEKRMNAQLSKVVGQIAGFYTKLIRSALLRSIYATLIVAVNEDVPRKMGKLTPERRRERLAAVLHLFDNDPKAINLSHTAKMFRVSRDVIYNDLRKLGVKR